MAKSTKTINVKSIVDVLNAKIIIAKTEDEKKGICTAIEEILHSTDNYRGYGYNLNNDQWKFLYDNKLSLHDAIDMGWLTEYDRHYSNY